MCLCCVVACLIGLVVCGDCSYGLGLVLSGLVLVLCVSYVIAVGYDDFVLIVLIC